MSPKKTTADLQAGSHRVDIGIRKNPTVNRKTRRLGFGDYARPDHEFSELIWSARLELFSVVPTVYPTFLDVLAADVLPKYHRLAQAGFDFDKILWTERPFSRLSSSEAVLRDALVSWASHFNAKRDWLLNQSLRTLRDWSIDPRRLQSRTWNTLGDSSGVVVCGERFQFSTAGWEMLVFRWPVYAACVRKRFEEALSEYEKRARKYAESRGLRRVPKTYSLANLEWFALYQFAGMSSVKIAKKFPDSDPSTILKGVKAAAGLIRWNDLRRSPRRT